MSSDWVVHGTAVGVVRAGRLVSDCPHGVCVDGACGTTADVTPGAGSSDADVTIRPNLPDRVAGKTPRCLAVLRPRWRGMNSRMLNADRRAIQTQ
jgi:hypothetical protein